MKRIIGFTIALFLILLVTACKGNYEQVELKDTMEIPQNGVIESKMLKEIKNGNAVATFVGESNGFKYEWTIFGRDIDNVRDVNLSVALEKCENGLKIKFNETKDFGFPALLSVHLNEKWTADSATAFSGEAAVYSVSVTGSKTSILNISVSKIVAEIVVVPDKNESTTTDSSDDREYSDGSATNQDKYQTDPVPDGKPLPVEPENQEIDKKKSYTCTFSIECSTILNNLADLDPDKLELVPVSGMILAPTKVTFYEGESVFDVLQRVCKENDIHLESSWTPIYNSAYVEGIHNLYEFDCGALSGWMYRVDGWYPNYGCSRYQLKDGEKIEWRYTCDLGKDVGCDWLAGS